MLDQEMIEETVTIADPTKPLVQSELTRNPKKRVKNEQIFEQDFWSLEELNLWQGKMTKEAG